MGRVDLEREWLTQRRRNRMFHVETTSVQLKKLEQGRKDRLVKSHVGPKETPARPLSQLTKEKGHGFQASIQRHLDVSMRAPCRNLELRVGGERERFHTKYSCLKTTFQWWRLCGATKTRPLRGVLRALWNDEENIQKARTS